MSTRFLTFSFYVLYVIIFANITLTLGKCDSSGCDGQVRWLRKSGEAFLVVIKAKLEEHVRLAGQ